MGKGVGEVVATRTIADRERRILIEIGKPVPTLWGRDFRCGFRVQGRGESTVRGVDGLAALYNALIAVGDELAAARREGADLTVFGQFDMRFPVRAPRGRNRRR
ncbi:DUF6968 family protein [Nocardia sp. NPDC003482]|uniref:DUF6968 family protein n=1 Tax=Nocardia sp. NPDC004068 TaxID=3364303 RepID=UPI0036CDC941